MTLTLANLKAKLLIDKHALDDEIMKQPQLFAEISEQAVLAAAERDYAKEELKVTDARLDVKWRKKLANAVKVTEKVIENHVLTDSDHEKAFDVWLQAKTKADNLDILKDSFQQRSSMLRDLVTLYAANYYLQTSIKPSKEVEASHYSANRARISNARVARGKLNDS